MKPTKFFKSKATMTAFAKQFAKNANSWFLRTTLHCNHDVIGKRKAIVLVKDETIVQRLIQCNTCKQAVFNNLKIVENEQ